MPPALHITRTHLFWGLILAIVGTAILIGLWIGSGLDLQTLKDWMQAVTQWMGKLPPALFAIACVFVFLFPMPASAVFVAAGAAYGIQKGLAVAVFGILGNQLLAYFLAAYWMRKPLIRWLARRGYNLPEVPPGKSADIVLLIRLTPASPLFVQNYLLGIARVNVLPYIAVSFPCTMTHVFGFLLVGSSLYSENITLAISGVLFLCFVVLCVKLLRDWRQHKRRRANAR